MIDARLLATRRSLLRLAGGLLLAGLLAAPLGILLAAQPLCACGDLTSKQSVGRQIVESFATEAYARWVLDNPGRRCPTDVSELGAYAGDRDAQDPWGMRLTVLCDGPGGRLGVVSGGPDGRLDTADDIRSWDPDPRAER